MDEAPRRKDLVRRAAGRLRLITRRSDRWLRRRARRLGRRVRKSHWMAPEWHLAAPLAAGRHPLGFYRSDVERMLHALARSRAEVFFIQIGACDGVADDELVEHLRKNQLDFVQVKDIKDWSRDVQLPEFRENFEATQIVESRFQLIAWNVQRKIFEDKREAPLELPAKNR